MVSWETNDKNPSLKTFYLQPREQSRAFRREKSPEPKNSVSYREAPSTRLWSRKEVLFAASGGALCVVLDRAPIKPCSPITHACFKTLNISSLISFHYVLLPAG